MSPMTKAVGAPLLTALACSIITSSFAWMVFSYPSITMAIESPTLIMSMPASSAIAAIG